MKKIVNGVKVLFLFVALLMIGWAATSSTETAHASTWCGESGHSCHVEVGGTTHHLKKYADY